MLIGVRCKFLIDCLLLIKRFERRNMVWESGEPIRYISGQSRFSKTLSRTVYVVDTENPNRATRTSLTNCLKNNITVMEFDEFFNKNFISPRAKRE